MKHPICAIGGAALLVAVGAASPAHADLCEQWDRAEVADKYMVQNNRWNDQLPGHPAQCIKVIDQGVGPGFAITQQTGSAPTNGKPVSYPSIYIGCHYGKCSHNTNLPMQVKSIKTAETGIVSLKYVGGATFDAAYDIWLDPSPNNNGANQQEIMIWLNRQGSIQPIGGPVDQVKIAGQTWEVWLTDKSNKDKNTVISYVAANPLATIATFNVMEFIADAAKRSTITNDFYLTSIQAGFEPWQGGTGLAIEGFQATVTP